MHYNVVEMINIELRTVIPNHQLYHYNEHSIVADNAVNEVNHLIHD